GGFRRGAMPVLFAGRKPNNIARMYFLDRAAFALRPAAARGHDQSLPQRVCVPGRASPGLKCHAGSCRPRRRRCLEQGIDPHSAGEPILLISITTFLSFISSFLLSETTLCSHICRIRSCATVPVFFVIRSFRGF